MPHYDYQCEKCHHQLEALQKMKDEPLKLCPNCQHPTLKRKIGGGIGLVFGSGFYSTNYDSPPPSSTSAPASDKPEHKHSTGCACGKPKNSCS